MGSNLNVIASEGPHAGHAHYALKQSFKMRLPCFFWLAMTLVLVFELGGSYVQAATATSIKNHVYQGMKEDDLLTIYPKDKIRDLRHDGSQDWITFNVPLDDPFHKLVTYYFRDNKLVQWKFNDRPEVIKEYLGEFCFYQPPSMTYFAIKDVMQRMPYKDFLYVTNRQRPILFTEFYDSGTARFASSSEFIVTEDDPPCCTGGFTIIKLGMALGLAQTPGPIEGVVAHEIAHRVLEHIKNGDVSCDAERASNRLIRKWGFKKEFKEASQLFGSKKGDPAACQEVTHQK